MNTIYSTKVTNIGEQAAAFSEEKMIILFKDNAPEELADYCVLHNGNELLDVVQNGDILVVADKEYKILYVGDEVQLNLKQLGHITLRFDGSTDGLGGSIYLENKELPTIKSGDVISICRQ